MKLSKTGISFITGAALLSFAFAPLLVGSETPDFSGTWILDTDAGDVPSGGRGGGGGRGGRGGGQGGRGGRGQGFGPAEKLEIKAVEGGFEVTSEGRPRPQTILPDQGAQTVSGPRGDSSVESRWEESVLVVKLVTERETPRGQMTIERVQRWRLSEDGKTLTQEMVTKTPRGDRESTFVYRRQ